MRVAGFKPEHLTKLCSEQVEGSTGRAPPLSLGCPLSLSSAGHMGDDECKPPFHNGKGAGQQSKQEIAVGEEQAAGLPVTIIALRGSTWGSGASAVVKGTEAGAET